MKCGFCHSAIERGTEKIYVTRRGEIHYFCSGKCERNQLGLGRKARRVKWTDEYRKEKTARLKLLAERKEVKKKKKKTVKKKEVEAVKKLAEKKEGKPPAKPKKTGKKKPVKKIKSKGKK